METTFAGTIEILTSAGESIGLPVAAITAELVPVIVGAWRAIDGMTEDEPQARPTGRTPFAQWSGMDAQDQIVTVLLWRNEEG